MEPIIKTVIFGNWQRKVIAVLVAIVVWVFVNQSITETKTVTNVPVRVVNLPANKTVVGLLPNGYLSQRATLTLSGSKEVINKLEQGDMEVRIDAQTANADDWVVQLTKKNLVSLEPSLDLSQHINNVSHSEYIVKLSNLVTEKIPVIITAPTGVPPKGYEFLDLTPGQLTQTLSGPEEEIEKLKTKGLKLTFDLSKISKEELDALRKTDQNTQDDEISFIIPKKWKKVAIPFRKFAPEDLNDPDAEHLRIDFLRQNILPIKNEIPIMVFYPQKYSDSINPLTYSIAEGETVRIRNGITTFTEQTYVKDVSNLFLNIIRNNLMIVIIASPKNERTNLHWSLELIDPQELEDTYVAFVISNNKGKAAGHTPQREKALRKRFQEYVQKLVLYTAGGTKLNINSTLQNNKIVVTSSL